MAQYLLLICGDESRLANASPDEWQQMMAAHGTFTKQVADAGGQILGGEALQPTTTATTLRRQPSGDHLVTDGPFVETKEALGGFYLLEARDLDQALEFAKLCPGETIEVRPVFPTS
jgi:hypothetical protein